MNRTTSTKGFNSTKSSNMSYQPPKHSVPIYMPDSVKRNWLKKHGKSKYIDFDDAERRELRRYFDAIDADGSGEIAVDELEDPLIALGLVQGREEVQKLIQEVDEDGSGQIEFPEFLTIMSNIKNKTGDQESVLYNFFTSMISGKLMEDMEPSLPFLLNVSQFRRKKILEAIMQDDYDGYLTKTAGKKGEKPKLTDIKARLATKMKYEDSTKIMNAFKKQLILKKQQEKLEKGENPNDLSLDQPPSQDQGLISSKNGVFKQNEIKTHTGNLLLKPKSLPIQNAKKQN